MNVAATIRLLELAPVHSFPLFRFRYDFFFFLITFRYEFFFFFFEFFYRIGFFIFYFLFFYNLHKLQKKKKKILVLAFHLGFDSFLFWVFGFSMKMFGFSIFRFFFSYFGLQKSLSLSMFSNICIHSFFFFFFFPFWGLLFCELKLLSNYEVLHLKVFNDCTKVLLSLSMCVCVCLSSV